MASQKDEFARTIGDNQRPGSGKHIMALTRAPGVPNRAPITAAEVLAKASTRQDDRQVLSIFETRPIDSFDFNVSAFHKESLGRAGVDPVLVEFEIPVGFVAVLRRVEIFFDPPHNASLVENAAQIRILRSDSAIPANDILLFGVVESYAWDTHQIFGYWEKPGLVVEYNDAIEHSFGARMLGTLIPALNVPPARQIGSTPLNVK